MSTLVQAEMLSANVFPPGAGLEWFGKSLPSGGWLWQDGMDTAHFRYRASR